MNRGLMEPPARTPVTPVGLYPTVLPRREDDQAVPWYSNYANVVRVAWYLVGQHEPAVVVARMLEKPWDYTEEWTRMLTADQAGGCP